MRIKERQNFKLLHRIQNIKQNKKIGVGGREKTTKRKNVDIGFLVFGLNTEYRIQIIQKTREQKKEIVGKRDGLIGVGGKRGCIGWVHWCRRGSQIRERAGGGKTRGKKWRKAIERSRRHQGNRRRADLRPKYGKSEMI